MQVCAKATTTKKQNNYAILINLKNRMLCQFVHGLVLALTCVLALPQGL